jgi:hypothetical protein
MLRVFWLLLCSVLALDIHPNSLEGTEPSLILSDKQLALQRWFAKLTFLNKHDG